MNKTTVNIKGMHCKSCEMLVEDEILKIRSVKKVDVNQREGLAKIYHDSNSLKQNDIEQAIRDAGYEMGRNNVSFISNNVNDYKELVLSFFLAVLLYTILKYLGLFNISINSSTGYSSLPIVLLVGLTAGFSTCMALVGGLVLGISSRFSDKNPHATPVQRFKPHLYFNLGRVLSFFILGGLIGYAGSFIQLSGQLLGVLTIFVGLVMFVLGLQLIKIFPILTNFNFTLPKSLGRKLGIKEQDNKEYSPKNTMVLGALTFFLPCGFTQAMQLYAISTGSPMDGALTMGIFAIGTMPGLLGIGGLTSMVKGAFSRHFFRFAGLVVLGLAVFNISNGLNLTGLSITPLFASGKSPEQINDPNVTLENGVQVVKMSQHSNGYAPNSFTVLNNVPVKWVINSDSPYSCASTIILPKYNIRQNLQNGENIIEFTPTEAGTLNFSCAMGMYTGAFNVVEKDGKSLNQSTNIQTANAPAKGSSCGMGGCGCGGAKSPISYNAGPTPTPITVQEGLPQVIKTSYSQNSDIQPNRFNVTLGKPVRMEIYAQDDGSGCMSAIKVPGLVESPELLQKGKTIVFNFIPAKAGQYQITCAMGVPRGVISVN